MKGRRELNFKEKEKELARADTYTKMDSSSQHVSLQVMKHDQRWVG